jgi:mono/diheme cytochrome c family protein
MLAAAALLAALAGACALALADEEPIQLHEGSGRDLTAGHCVVCHSLDYIPNNAPVMDRGGWQKTIQKMRERYGAPLTDQEAQQILDYLAGNYAGKT